MEDIITYDEVKNWLRLDDDDPAVDMLIKSAYDAAEGCIDGFKDKLKSVKFKRKLKLFMLNYIVSAYDKRGLMDDSDGKMQFVNATLLMQLQYGTYSEADT